MSIAQAPIVPPPTVPGATQTAGTYPTDQARQEAALQTFQQVATQYPSTSAGLTARYQTGVALMALGRLPEAEQAFGAVADKAGASLYGSMARLGRAESLRYQGKYDDAIKALTDLAAERDGMLPVDGVLMQLAQTCLKAGKTQEARAAFKRVVDEFPDSNYVAEARQQLTTRIAGTSGAEHGPSKCFGSESMLLAVRAVRQQLVDELGREEVRRGHSRDRTQLHDVARDDRAPLEGAAKQGRQLAPRQAARLRACRRPASSPDRDHRDRS